MRHIRISAVQSLELTYTSAVCINTVQYVHSTLDGRNAYVSLNKVIGFYSTVSLSTVGGYIFSVHIIGSKEHFCNEFIKRLYYFVSTDHFHLAERHFVSPMPAGRHLGVLTEAVCQNCLSVGSLPSVVVVGLCYG